MPVTSRMPLHQGLPIALAIATLLGACASPPSRIEAQEEVLLTSGFKARSAQDLRGQNALRTLPPNRVVAVTRGGTTIFVYADPVNCKCLYRGNAEAYRRYRILASERNLADEKELSADLAMQAATPDEWNLVEPEGAW